MATPITQLSILRLLLQIEQNLIGLQRDMRFNAAAWKAQAQAQSVPIATLQGFMNTSGPAYQTRLAWLPTLQADAVNWPKVSALYTAIGGTGAEFSALMTPLSAVANQLAPATKDTYAQIIAICDQILAAIDAPLSLWPE